MLVFQTTYSLVDLVGDGTGVVAVGTQVAHRTERAQPNRVAGVVDDEGYPEGDEAGVGPTRRKTIAKRSQ